MAGLDSLKKVDLVVKSDERGSLVEIFKEEFALGQVYSFSCKKGKIRGNHYHKRKTETFCVLKGKAKITLVDIATKEKIEFLFDARKAIEKVFVPQNIIHVIEGQSKEDAIIVAYISEKYDPKDPDCHFLK